MTWVYLCPKLDKSGKADMGEDGMDGLRKACNSKSQYLVGRQRYSKKRDHVLSWHKFILDLTGLGVYQFSVSNVATAHCIPRESLHDMTCFSDASLDLKTQRLVMAEPTTSPSLDAIQFIPRRSRQEMAAFLG